MTTAPTVTPDVNNGHLDLHAVRVLYCINCSGTALNWGMCYEKADEICGAKGYIVLEKSGDAGAMVSGDQFGLYGGSVINRRVIIQCKGAETKS